MLQNLKAVDIVEFFDSEEELIALIKLYKPNIMVKGSDYRGQGIVGEAHVPKVFYYDRIGDYSTTKIIQDIANR
jgi:bifunctional ADP-heptose synthase (sugar kinase/adenylyltransferase)